MGCFKNPPHKGCLADGSLAAVQTMAWTVGAMVVGSALHPLMQAARRNNWCAACKQPRLALNPSLDVPSRHLPLLLLLLLLVPHDY